jgi:hypothetical protein
MLWHWQNDPTGLPDGDHTRCIAAPGIRQMLYRGRRFEMTTVVCPSVPRLARVPVSGSREFLQMEHVGSDAPHGLVLRYWRSQPFDSCSHGGMAQYAAGLDLLAMVATEVAAA